MTRRPQRRPADCDGPLPRVRLEVRQTAVQGRSAVSEVTRALLELDAHPDVDVIIVTRGGGSLEDLLPFSDEGLPCARWRPC